MTAGASIGLGPIENGQRIIGQQHPSGELVIHRVSTGKVDEYISAKNDAAKKDVANTAKMLLGGTVFGTVGGFILTSVMDKAKELSFTKKVTWGLLPGLIIGLTGAIFNLSVNSKTSKVQTQFIKENLQ